MFRASLCPSSGARDRILLRVVFTTWCAGWCLGKPGSRPRPHCRAVFSQPLWDRGLVNSFFIRRGPVPNRFTRQHLSIFLSSYIKLTQVLIINYGIIIKSNSTITCTVWHIDKYKLTFKLGIISRGMSRGPV